MLVAHIFAACTMVFASHVFASGTITLNKPQIEAPENVSYFLDKTGTMRVQDIIALPPNSLKPLNYKTHFNLRKHKVLWLRFNVHFPRQNAIIEGLAPNEWYAEIPNSLLDRVFLFEQKTDKSFYPTQIAGDLVANEFWTRPAKNPLFRLRLQPGQTHTVFIRVNNSTRTAVNLILANQSVIHPEKKMSSLIYGAISGGLLLASLYSLILGVFLKDKGFVIFSVYAFISLTINLAYSGVLAQYIFSTQPYIVDASHGVLILFSWGVSLVFVRTFCTALPERWRATLFWLPFVYFISATLFPFIDRFPYGSMLIVVLVPTAPILSLYTTFISYKNGDQIALWALTSYLLFSFSIIFIMLMVFGMVPKFTSLENMILISQAAIIPPLLAALHARTIQQQTLTLRGQALEKNDALTGLLKEKYFKQKIAFFKNSPLSVRTKTAIAILDIGNLNRIALNYGSTVSEQSMLRTVIKIKKALGDIDNVARVGHARIAFLIRNTDKEEMRTLAHELVTSGARAPKKLTPKTPLHYHVAIGFLPPIETENDALVLDELHHMLDKTLLRTRKPIRFLDEFSTESSSKKEQRQTGNALSTKQADDTLPSSHSSQTATRTTGFDSSHRMTGSFGPSIVDRE